jgi:hypothetical protein
MNERQIKLIEEITNKFSEHFEMAGGQNVPFLMIDHLTKLLLQEKDKVECLEKRIRMMEHGKEEKRG